MKETVLFWTLVVMLNSWAIAGILRSIQIWRELRDDGDSDEDDGDNGGEDAAPDPPLSPHHQVDPDFDPADWWKRRAP